MTEYPIPVRHLTAAQALTIICEYAESLKERAA